MKRTMPTSGITPAAAISSAAAITPIATISETAAITPTAGARRNRILEAATELLASGGREAVSSRAVSAVAGVQAPTIYRIFGDMNGLLDAVAEHGYNSYIASRDGLPRSNDPITDIRNGWDLHVDLGLDNPALYGLIYSDPHGTEIRPALATVARGLQRTVKRIAEIGRLGMSEERATHLVHAANRGLVLTLMSLPEDQRDRTLSDTARDSVIATIITDHPSQAPSRAIAAAATLRAVLGQVTALTPLERELLGEWLDRIADSTD